MDQQRTSLRFIFTFRIVLYFDEIITRLNYANLNTILGGDVKVKVNYVKQ